jgi:hypothetical protein
MAWSHLGTQFCLELAFGVLLGLCFVQRAPLGLFFHRLMGVTAVLPLMAAAAAPPLFVGASWSSGVTVASLAALLGFPVFSGPFSARRRTLGAIWSTSATALALALAVRIAPGITGTGDWILGSLSAMATGVVAGGVGLAMVVGHWYLTVPQLPVVWLRKLNRLTALAMVVSSGLLVASIVAHSEALALARTPLLGPWGLFYLSARVGVGLALPLLFAWMTAGSLRYENTRSATGILYASTVLVLIGAAVSLSLQDSYGIPL